MQSGCRWSELRRAAGRGGFFPRGRWPHCNAGDPDTGRLAVAARTRPTGSVRDPERARVTLSPDLTLVEKALDELERREVRVLVWGLVDSALSEAEVLEVLDQTLDTH